MTIDSIRRYTGRLLSIYVSTLDLDIDGGRAGSDAESIAAAGSAIALAIVGLGASRYFLNGPDVSAVGPAIVVLVLIWLAMTFIASTRDRISLHLNLVSFWILITCLTVVVVRTVRPPPDYGATERFLASLFVLGALVPIHIARCKIHRYRKLLYVALILGGHGVIAYLAAQP